MIAAEEFNKICIDKVEKAEVLPEPFAHLVIDDFLPPDFYKELMMTLNSDPGFKASRYAGVGLNTKALGYHAYGLTLPHNIYPKICQQLGELLQSDQFVRALIDPFDFQQIENSNAIPANKQVHYHDNNDDFHCLHHIQIDLPGYRIPPHADDPSKIITYLLYLDSEIPDEYSATLLCTPSKGRLIPRRLMRTTCSAAAGSQSAQWFPWNWFQVNKRINDVPNRLLAFAPNANSYHAVNFAPSVNSNRHQRRVARGFVRAGKKVFDRVSYCTA